jgi:hypothetical protein
MRQTNATIHLLATLAVTAVAVAAAFVLPTSAHALTITIVGDAQVNAVHGSGKQVDRLRNVGAFSILRVDGPIDVEAHPGAAPGAIVHADDNIEPLVETTVEGDALVVRLRKGQSFRSSHKVFVEVVFSRLDAAQQHGSGNLHIVDLRSPKFESTITGSGDLTVDNAQFGSFAVKIAGSGNVKTGGRADEARYSVAGSGDIDAEALVTRRVNVSISGSGDAHVNATDAIDARVSGSGDISYSGHPHDVSRRVNGSGSIESSN